MRQPTDLHAEEHVTEPGDHPPCQSAELSRTLEAAARGDQAAWRAVIDLYGKRVFALAKSRVRRADLAEEIAQSVFVTVATKLNDATGGYTEQGRFEAWLFRIAINRVRDELRRLKRHATPTDPEVIGQTTQAAAANDAADTDTIDRLRSAMLSLSDPDREVIELRHHGGLSFAQIADMLQEPLGTLLARHHRALRKLKSHIERSATNQPRTTEEIDS